MKKSEETEISWSWPFRIFVFMAWPFLASVLWILVGALFLVAWPFILTVKKEDGNEEKDDVQDADWQRKFSEYSNN